MAEKGTFRNGPVTKVDPKPRACAEEERATKDQAVRQACDSIFVQANVVTVKELMDAQKGSEASKPAEVSSVPPRAVENSHKKILQPEGNVSNVGVDGSPDQVVGRKRPVADASEAKQPAQKRRKILNTRATPLPDTVTRNDARIKPGYTGMARPRSAAPTAKFGNSLNQQRESVSDSGDSGTRLLEVNGRRKRVVIEDSDDEEEAPAPKRHCPETAGAPGGRSCSKSPEDAVHKPSIVLEKKADPCKRKRDDDKDEFEHQADNDRLRARKSQRSDSGSDKENKRSPASSTSSQTSIKAPQRPPKTISAKKVPAKGSFAELMARAEKVKAENAEQVQQIGMIRHRPTGRPVFSTRSIYAGRPEAVPNESITTSKRPLTDAQFEALRSAAEMAQKKLDDALDLAVDPKTRKYVFKNLIGKSRGEKAKITKNREKWHGIIEDFREARNARQKALAATEAKAQISDNEKKEPRLTQ
ncbi:hypothetical protein A1O7_01407 [Cladophialophora yegresii CBS 114405]|uniref:Uncharacterized protein n=1 Tax=Cladophialophora yegresii CBS 114405 TaxID=1182544 RepID=W9WAB6_9EURO|nr:uncharacterized protein A1O7_01407 [Cladophialophora yegresii CBS 114405]EXJ65067.1 hypothetical protein A1O7_01407 [Cladophialophora yegresii CBS 114405]